MANGGGSASFGPFFLLLLIILILVIVGGTTEQGGGSNVVVTSNTSEEINRPSGEPGGAQIWSKTELETEKLIGTHSSLFGKINLLGGSLYPTDPSFEYLELDASNLSSKTLLTGMEVRSAVSGAGLAIGKGVYRPFFSSSNIEDPIYINKGDRVFLISGRSPIGYSFMVNKCTGFFSQNKEFSPFLLQECPHASSFGYPQVPLQYKNICYDYIDSLGSCFMPTNFIPEDIGPECTAHVTTKINYDQCVEKHQGDSDFFKPVWYVYLNRPEEMWDSRREFIKLLDSDKKTIDYLDYR